MSMRLAGRGRGRGHSEFYLPHNHPNPRTNVQVVLDAAQLPCLCYTNRTFFGSQLHCAMTLVPSYPGNAPKLVLWNIHVEYAC